MPRKCSVSATGERSRPHASMPPGADPETQAQTHDPSPGPRVPAAPNGSHPLSFLRLSGTAKKVVDWTVVIVAAGVLVTAVGAIGAGFQGAAGGRAEQLFRFAENPFVGLMIGVLATVLTQSSTTTTSITVGLVAGGLPIQIAIPILFGANIGTTMTAQLVALAMAKDKEMFRRGYAAASVHDMYNLLSVLIFFPLELAFSPLRRLSGWLAGNFAGEEAGAVGTAFQGMGAGLGVFIGPSVAMLERAVAPLGQPAAGVTLVLVGVLLILTVITLISRMLKELLVGRARRIFDNAIGRGAVTGVLSGALITMLVQSSTTTTSLAVPFAATGKFGLRQIFHFVVGANIGTTLTALIAAFGFSGVEGQTALQAALVHLLYNLMAATLILLTPGLRALPPKGATLLSRLGTENTWYIVGWILLVFLVVPGTLILLTVLI